MSVSLVLCAKVCLMKGRKHVLRLLEHGAVWHGALMCMCVQRIVGTDVDDMTLTPGYAALALCFAVDRVRRLRYVNAVPVPCHVLTHACMCVHG